MKIPSDLLNSLQNIKGFNKETFIAVHESDEQITSIRFNPFKSKQPIANNTQLKKIPWSSQGYYLNERPSFTLDPLFHAGTYYVQEASSMFVEQALKQTVDLSAPIKILDVCAAPGGKSTLIQSVINGQSLLVSNEIIKARVNIVTENIIKWGAANVIVTNNDPKDFNRLQNYFDAIIIDAPCSGSGLFRKDSAAIEEWSINNVKLCNLRQQRIVADVFSSLKENGILIYSTCSYSKEENENICDWMIEELKVESLKLKVEMEWGIVETESDKYNAIGYRFYPDKIKGEGFFIAVFKKVNREWTIDKTVNPKHKLQASKSQKLIAESEIIKPWLQNAHHFFLIKQHEEIIAMPLHLQNDLILMQAALYIKKAGVRLGNIIRNELIPHHELALSNSINSSIPFVSVDLETALQYLRKQEIKIDSNNTGWILIKYQHHNLGWVKILPNRINNYYPKEYRIVNK